MSATQILLFLIVGKNEPLFEAEFHKRGGPGNSDAVARQNYFVVHSALDLVEKAQWTTQNVRMA
jgi:trafficking protein particle complex subunit 2